MRPKAVKLTLPDVSYTAMDFFTYPKIAQKPHWDPDDARYRSLEQMQWVATEKIHGANLCLCSDGERVQVAKRRALLQPDEYFFGYRAVIGPLLNRIKALSRAVIQQYACRSVLIYGELAGGGASHTSANGLLNQPVQTGIYYGPDIRFFAFDLAAVTHDAAFRMLPFNEALQWFKQFQLEAVPILATGKLGDLLALSPVFPSRVLQQLGFAPLPNNVAEGLVLKLWDRVLADNVYPQVKRINPKFSETRFHQSEVVNPTQQTKPMDVLNELESILHDLLTDQRIYKAMSKTGRPQSLADEDLIEEVIRETLMDLRETLDEEYGERVLTLSDDDYALFWSVAQDHVRSAVEQIIQDSDIDDFSDRYYADLVRAYVKGMLPERDITDLFQAATDAGLKIHKFKRKSGLARVLQVLSLLEGLQPESLLDIGPGRGAFLWPLLDRFPTLPVTAMDRLSHRVDLLQTMQRGGINRLQGIQGDVCAMPFTAGQFDVVTVLEVLEHLLDPAKAACEILRVARRFVVASVPSHPDNNPEHLRLFTKDSLSQLFYDAGAQRVQISYVRDHMLAVVPCPNS